MAHLHQKFHHHQIAKREDVGTFDEVMRRDPDPQVLSVVFVTLTPTFTGSVASYTTLTDADTSTTSQGAIVLGSPVAQSQTITSKVNTSASGGFDFNTVSSNSATATSTEKHRSSTLATIPSQIPSPSSISFNSQTTPLKSAIATTTLLTSVASISQANTQTAVAAASATASSQPSSDTTHSGLSTGAKAGLAIGVIILIAAVAIGALLLYSRKKKREDYHKANDEKTLIGGAAVARGAMSDSARSGLPPRLSLRPVSKLLPDLMGGVKKRASQGNPLSTFNQGTGTTGTGRSLTPTPQVGSPWERRPAEEPAAGINPFSDPQNPFTDAEKAPPPPTMTPTTTNPAVAAGIAGTAAGVGLAAMAASARAQSPSPLTPASGRASPGPSAGPGNVYRIQIDFKPSMDDELELRAGQLVRMVHEYDDGWALCTRLDRSQQGVAPRTCLAANPSKPRPVNGGPGPNTPRPLRPGQNGRMSPAMSRPRSPAGMQGPRMPAQRSASPGLNSPRPGTSDGPRSMSPGPGAFNLAPRPLSPGPRPSPKRSMSPGPYGPGGSQRPKLPIAKRRSNSASNVRERRESPPGPSKLGPGPAGQR